MGFSDHTPRTYFYDSKGKVVVGKKDNQVMHDDFEGYLRGIKYVENQVEFTTGKPTTVKQWYVFFTDDEGREYVWTTRYTGITFQSFINCLSSLDEITKHIKISFYLKKERTKIATYYGGTKLDWKYTLEEMPAVEPVMVGNKPYKDPNGNTVYNFEPRMEWTQKLVDRVNELLGFNPTIVNGNNEPVPINESDEVENNDPRF